MKASFRTISASPSTMASPYPPLGDLDNVIRTVIQEAPSLDAVLHAVRGYAERLPRGGEPFFRPRPGLHTDPTAHEEATRLSAADEGTWFHMLLYNAGNACLRAGDLNLALEVYKQALLGFDHPAVYNNIAAVLVERRRPTEARMWLERGVARDPQYPQTYLNLCSISLTHDVGGDPVAWLTKYREIGGGPGMLRDFLAALPEDEATRYRELCVNTIPECLPSD